MVLEHKGVRALESGESPVSDTDKEGIAVIIGEIHRDGFLRAA